VVMASEAQTSVPDAVACAGSVERTLGWALMAVNRSYALESVGALGDLPGGPRGYLVLLASTDETPATQQALGRRVGVDRSVMTYLVDDLIGAGLVDRQPDPDDRRARRIAVTEAGRRRLQLIEQRLADAEARVFRDLTAEQRRTLRDLLHLVALTTPGGTEACLDSE
jgi:DNA-binding MarR family transcriptional regulator